MTVIRGGVIGRHDALPRCAVPELARRLPGARVGDAEPALPHITVVLHPRTGRRLDAAVVAAGVGVVLQHRLDPAVPEPRPPVQVRNVGLRVVQPLVDDLVQGHDLPVAVHPGQHGVVVVRVLALLGGVRELEPQGRVRQDPRVGLPPAGHMADRSRAARCRLE